ncbi:cutinase [Austwickia chelonae]|uniref:PET hydrolase/cutinase-like domain-containing protein n=1 Tax=Austwickia chelonae NBRC 105200 TaxID=1184607 RepID=K6VJX6_9MICO|nr:alpha/beta hydrolase [Austwickia chelonae]GAB76994.1 hypothetical protein AUCHE_04_00340 [Austwickia chelonae NBRC 105200]SEW33118.1 cutinase [Austwickia chelonae]
MTGPAVRNTANRGRVSRGRRAAVALGLSVALALGAITAPASAIESTVVQTPATSAPDGKTRLGTPAPTKESLRADGPYTVETQSMTGSQTPSGFAEAQFTWPVGVPDGPRPTVVLMPGFVGEPKTLNWLVKRLASHGYAVALIEPPTRIDGPAARAKALRTALPWLISESPLAPRIDQKRVALFGFSMGGGGVIDTASAPTVPVKAVVAAFPWNTRKTFPSLSAPTLVLAGQGDGVAVPEWFAIPIYKGITGTSDKAFAHVSNAHHTLVETPDPRISEMTMAWLGRFLLDDTRYNAFICPGPTTGTDYHAYEANCS